MKRLILISISLLLIASVTFGANISLKASWTPNTETDMAGYNLYRIDGARSKINSTLIAHPPALPYQFSITVPDGSEGTAMFILTAVDSAGNESGDSNNAPFPFDYKAPAAPAGFGVSKP